MISRHCIRYGTRIHLPCPFVSSKMIELSNCVLMSSIAGWTPSNVMFLPKTSGEVVQNIFSKKSLLGSQMTSFFVRTNDQKFGRCPFEQCKTSEPLSTKMPALLTGWLQILEGVPYQSWLFTSILKGHIKKTHLPGKCFPRKPLYPSPDLSKFDAGSKSCPVIPSLPFPAISPWQMAMNTFPGVLTVSL